MIQTLFLTAPVYVTFFWFLLLLTTTKKAERPKRFLGLFMFVAFLLYVGHLLFFSDLWPLYYWMDPVYQFASLLVYPLYYIYFRLLMVDNRFQFKRHAFYLIPSVLLVLLYVLGMSQIPKDEFIHWLACKPKPAMEHCPELFFMNGVSRIIRVVFILQAVVTLIANFVLIRNNRDKAAQYYSELQDSRIDGVIALNVTLLVTTISSIVLSLIGKNAFSHEWTYLLLASILFSTTLFLIGWLGIRQRTMYPDEQETLTLDNALSPEINLSETQDLLDQRIQTFFDLHKIYLKPNLTIQDVAQAVGTNRTYISGHINQRYHLNFCTFVNHHRVDEAERILKQNPQSSMQQLADVCGFGSTDSLKRAVLNKSGLSFAEWRKQVTSTK